MHALLAPILDKMKAPNEYSHAYFFFLLKTSIALSPLSIGAPVRPIKVSSRVTQSNINNYNKDGATIIRGVFDDVCVGMLQSVCSRVLKNPGPHAEDIAADGYAIPDSSRCEGISSFGYYSEILLSDYDPSISNFALSGGAAELAALVAGSKTMRFMQDQLFVKPAGATGGVTSWHADASYCAVRGDQIISVFIALDDTPAEECLEFIPGSHLWAEPKVPYSDTVNKQIEESSKLSWAMRAGDCLAFQGRTVHGGSGGWGRALALRYVGDDVTWCERAPLFSHLVCSECSDEDICGGKLKGGGRVTELPVEGICHSGHSFSP